MKTTITAAEFCQIIAACRLLDEHMRFIGMEETALSQWCFDDKGCHYISPSERREEGEVRQ